jgi:hypothetical protein
LIGQFDALREVGTSPAHPAEGRQESDSNGRENENRRENGERRERDAGAKKVENQPPEEHRQGH